jgi:hypothetical protein
MTVSVRIPPSSVRVVAVVSDQNIRVSIPGPTTGSSGGGGSVAWAMGEIPIILALIATFIQWMRDDKRETKRIDRNEARLAAMGEPDELAQYNNYLSQLQRRDEKEGRS